MYSPSRFPLPPPPGRVSLANWKRVLALGEETIQVHCSSFPEDFCVCVCVCVFEKEGGREGEKEGGRKDRERGIPGNPFL